MKKENDWRGPCVGQGESPTQFSVVGVIISLLILGIPIVLTVGFLGLFTGGQP